MRQELTLGLEGELEILASLRVTNCQVVEGNYLLILDLRLQKGACNQRLDVVKDQSSILLRHSIRHNATSLSALQHVVNERRVSLAKQLFELKFWLFNHINLN